MVIFSWPSNFRIKSKADAERFLTISHGTLYWTDGETDYCLEDGKVSTRPVFCRGDIFAPYFRDSNGYADLVWKTRKYINAILAG